MKKLLLSLVGAAMIVLVLIVSLSSPAYPAVGQTEYERQTLQALQGIQRELAGIHTELTQIRKWTDRK